MPELFSMARNASSIVSARAGAADIAAAAMRPTPTAPTRAGIDRVLASTIR